MSDGEDTPATRVAGRARPRVGQEVQVVLLGRRETALVTARVLFDKGRGLVLESCEPRLSLSGKERGRPLLLVYATDEGVFHFRGNLSEILTKTRFYIMPVQDPREMEKREYIRAVLKLPAVLSLSPVEDRTPLPTDPVTVELSASGFRWFSASDAREGAQVWLVLGPPEPLILPGRVLRVSMGPAGPEVAGAFTSLTQREREALLRLVFRSRLSEMGVGDVETF